jgi:hypothetical protein
MKIVKTKVLVTVLSEDVPPEFDSLEELARFIDYGDGIGQYSVESHEEVPADKVEEELIAIGNDGTFFDVPEEGQ